MTGTWPPTDWTADDALRESKAARAKRRRFLYPRRRRESAFWERRELHDDTIYCAGERASRVGKLADALVPSSHYCYPGLHQAARESKEAPPGRLSVEEKAAEIEMRFRQQHPDLPVSRKKSRWGYCESYLNGPPLREAIWPAPPYYWGNE